MRIAIIETGAPPAPLDMQYPPYPAMLERVLAPMAPHSSFFSANVKDGPLPSIASFDGALITGSPAGVYEEHAWIQPLEEFVRNVGASGKPQVGVCFGHQIMAQAFGGAVEKSDKGWGVGLHRYDVKGRAPWMTPSPSRIACAVSHQDQVIRGPDGARTLAGSDFCPHAILDYTGARAMSYQMHPEFEHGYAADLMRLRAERIGEERVDEGLASLQQRSDRGLLAEWIVNFFKG